MIDLIRSYTYRKTHMFLIYYLFNNYSATNKCYLQMTELIAI